MKIYFDLKVKNVVDGYLAEDDIISLLEAQTDIIIKEREAVLNKKYPVINDRAVASYFLNLYSKKDEIILDILNDNEYKKLLGIKIIRRNNCNVIIYKGSLIFKITEQKEFLGLSRTNVIR